MYEGQQRGCEVNFMTIKNMAQVFRTRGYKLNPKCTLKNLEARIISDNIN